MLAAAGGTVHKFDPVCVCACACVCVCVCSTSVCVCVYCMGIAIPMVQ